MRKYRSYKISAFYESLEQKLSLSSLLAGPTCVVVGDPVSTAVPAPPKPGLAGPTHVVVDDPVPDPEPDPGDLPTDEPPILVPPIPPSGPVGPG